MGITVTVLPLFLYCLDHDTGNIVPAALLESLFRKSFGIIVVLRPEHTGDLAVRAHIRKTVAANEYLSVRKLHRLAGECSKPPD